MTRAVTWSAPPAESSADTHPSGPLNTQRHNGVTRCHYVGLTVARRAAGHQGHRQPPQGAGRRVRGRPEAPGTPPRGTADREERRCAATSGSEHHPPMKTSISMTHGRRRRCAVTSGCEQGAWCGCRTRASRPCSLGQPARARRDTGSTSQPAARGSAARGPRRSWSASAAGIRCAGWSGCRSAGAAQRWFRPSVRRRSRLGGGVRGGTNARQLVLHGCRAGVTAGLRTWSAEFCRATAAGTPWRDAFQRSFGGTVAEHDDSVEQERSRRALRASAPPVERGRT